MIAQAETPALVSAWAALVARVDGGESIRDVAHSAGVTSKSLAARVTNTRRWGVASESEWWTPARDLVLAETLTAGGGKAGASRALRCPPDACVRRWRHLMPEPGTEAQAKLLRRLRAAVAKG